jgi:hypothetical protein
MNIINMGIKMSLRFELDATNQTFAVSVLSPALMTPMAFFLHEQLKYVITICHHNHKNQNLMKPLSTI